MLDSPPDPRQYEIPAAVREKHAKHLRAMGDVSEAPPPEASQVLEPSQITKEFSVAREAPSWSTSLSARSQSILKTNTKLADSLLSWLSYHVNSSNRKLAINANGFIVQVEVHDIKLENGQLLITIPSDAKISFVLEDGATLKLKWEDDKDWASFMYLHKLEFGTGFPFFFMVFLENNV